jgi:hypothetical protein
MKKNQNNFFSEGLKYRKCINFNSKLCFNKECSKCKKFEITKGRIGKCEFEKWQVEADMSDRPEDIKICNCCSSCRNDHYCEK